MAKKKIIREPTEIRNRDEIEALKQNDTYDKPENWFLSPRMVETFILGSDEAIEYKVKDKKKKIKITRKFYGDNVLVQRSIITLASDRGAGISHTSLNGIQGTAGVTEDQIKYSWNYAMLLAEGPSLNALVPSPVYVGMKDGLITRFEEVTRCPREIQDTLISILSDKVLIVPELGEKGVLLARKGFNIIGTANTRDKGVNEMSSALKRRFNFETVHPIKSVKEEIEVVQNQTEGMLESDNVKVEFKHDIYEILVKTFHELRRGETTDGVKVNVPSTVMSTAEAVSVAYNSGLYARYYDDGVVKPKHLAINIKGAVIKDNNEDIQKLNQYWDLIVKRRGSKNKDWSSYYDSKKYFM
jgi:hypothetical protein